MSASTLTRRVFSASLLAIGAVAQSPPPARLRQLKFTLGELHGSEIVVPSTTPLYDLPANRIIFLQRDVRLVVQAAGDQPDAVFVINGLANPDIQVPVGARITFTVIDVSSMFPDFFVVTAKPPPYLLPLTTPSAWAFLRNVAGKKAQALPPTSADPTGRTLFDVGLVYQVESAGVAYYYGAVEAGIAGGYGRIIVVP